MSLLQETLQTMVPQSDEWRGRATRHIEQLAMPHWALGRILDLAVDLAGMTRSLQPAVARKAVVVMAGDHGVVDEGVSLFPADVTLQMMGNFLCGGAGINAFAATVDAEVWLADLGAKSVPPPFVQNHPRFLDKHVGRGTANMAIGPAMTRQQAIQSLEAGIEVAMLLGRHIDLFGTGDMGIGNTTPSSAILAAYTGRPVRELVGRGTGLNDAQMEHKIAVIEKALALNRPDANDALDVLAKVGGFEIGGLAGLILGAAAQKKPVVIDGFISTAAALIACKLSPASANYMIASHSSVEQGHAVLHECLGKSPLLNLRLRLGEGTGAALAMNLVQAAANTLTQMATFEQASISWAKETSHFAETGSQA